MVLLPMLAHRKHIVYDGRAKAGQVNRSDQVIRSFADRETERLFSTGAAKRFPPDIARRAIGRLQHLHLANRVEDLRKPPSNRLEALKGDRAGQWSIRVNEQWRLCFRFEGGDAFDVEIVDYH
ncbi:type II toxin-antitoxin system RelE/ParE family toxin [Rhodanobacter sp. FW510-R10]|uniref:type II toxin-antitoxin system RelE/ParE family toxin n=1 Tax=unclassified Rhodanobacter TaxID=2621553 RepID=UPI00387EC602